MRAALLTFLLVGCASAPQVTKLLPPPELAQDCRPVVEQVKTNGGLVDTILAYRESLRLCNNDKRALREWAEKENE